MSYNGALGFGSGRLAWGAQLGAKIIRKGGSFRRGLLTESYAEGPTNVSSFAFHELAADIQPVPRPDMLLTIHVPNAATVNRVYDWCAFCQGSGRVWR